MDSECTIMRLVFFFGRPIVCTPADARWSGQEQPQRVTLCHFADFMVESPERIFAGYLMPGVALRRLRRHIEDIPVSQGAAQFQIFGVRPDERHGRAGWFAEEQFAFGDVGSIPGLFWEQTIRVGKRFKRGKQVSG